MISPRSVLATLVLTAGITGAAAGAELAIYPPEIKLESATDRQGFRIILTGDDGRSRDVTAVAELDLPAGLVRVEERALLPVSDGQGPLKARFEGLTAEAAIAVTGAGARPAITFRNDVIPVLTRSGCNAGSCHGASRGKDGFRLSLFGYDPEGDHRRLTVEEAGRRLNLAAPEASLMIEKALGRVRHTGGRRITEDSEHYQTLIRWIEAGAPKDPKDLPELVAIELFPPAAVLTSEGERLPLLVRARFSDGRDRDVTADAVFFSNNSHSASVSNDGEVSPGARGEAFVMARYGSITVGSQIIVSPRGAPPSFPEAPEADAIDHLVDAKLRKLSLRPSELCDDATFLRRASLDIIGRLPSLEEQEAFFAEPEGERRTRLVDRLLEREEFTELWALRFAELLQIRSTNRTSPKAARRYYVWLRDQIAAKRPMSAIVGDLLTATGGTLENPAANYYELERNGLKLAENAAQVFLGMRIQCAQCHNHPFDRWTQDDYYGFAAFFAQIGRKRGADPREYIVFDRRRGETRHPVTGRNVAPKFLGGARPDTKNRDRRAVLAAWITSPDNPYFAKNLANVIWSQLFGIGIVEPVDDARVSNPPSNPALLEELARRLIDYGYDFRKLIRDIALSRAYQRSSAPNADNSGDNRNFSRAVVKRIKAEVLLDAIGQATNTREKFRGLPLGARAVEIYNGRITTHFLNIFGRPRRATVCSCEVKMEPTLSQALHLINGRTVTQNIRKGKILDRLLEAKTPPSLIIEAIYRRALCRPPGEGEAAALGKAVAAAKDKRAALEDIFWAVLNSREFLFNH